METKNLIFMVDRCMNWTRNDFQKPCKPIEEIDSFLEDVEVGNWIYQEQVDWNVYNEKPVFKTMWCQGKYLMNNDIYKKLFFYF